MGMSRLGVASALVLVALASLPGADAFSSARAVGARRLPESMRMPACPVSAIQAAPVTDAQLVPAQSSVAAEDIATASSLAQEVVIATTPQRRRKRDRVYSALARAGRLPLAGFRLIQAAAMGRTAARDLVEEACALDGDSEECSDSRSLRKGLGELRNLLRRTTFSAAGMATAPSRDGQSMQAGWERRGQGSALRRTIEVWRFLLSAVVKVVKARNKANKLEPEEASAAKTEAAIYIRDGLLDLGPTFIKLGQVCSTRTDVLEKEYIDVLKSLQDDVPAFSGETALQIVREELGRPVEDVFSSFDPTPLAAASLGQVHRAVLKENNAAVAVKVQRAGLKELFDLDLKNLQVLAKLLDALDPKTDGADRDWVSIYDESARLLYQEIDYLNEARNALRFAENFKAEADRLRVPGVYVELSTPRVLVMEFVESLKLTDISQVRTMHGAPACVLLTGWAPRRPLPPWAA